MSTTSRELVRYNSIAEFSADKFAQFIKNCIETDTQTRTAKTAHKSFLQ